MISQERQAWSFVRKLTAPIGMVPESHRSITEYTPGCKLFWLFDYYLQFKASVTQNLDKAEFLGHLFVGTQLKNGGHFQHLGHLLDSGTSGKRVNILL